MSFVSQGKESHPAIPAKCHLQIADVMDQSELSNMQSS